MPLCSGVQLHACTIHGADHDAYAERVRFGAMQGGGWEHAVRIAGNAGSEEWRFWVDLQPDRGQLHIELAVTYWQRSTAALDKLIAERMPPWTTLLSGVSMHSDWTF